MQIICIYQNFLLPLHPLMLQTTHTMANNNEITVRQTKVRTIQQNGTDYISLTDIAKQKNWIDPNGVIANWMRNRNTIEFLGIWEQINNPNFNPLEFEGFRKEAGLNAFTMSPTRWIEATNAIGIVSQSGRYGGTYAHKDNPLCTQYKSTNTFEVALDTY